MSNQSHPTFKYRNAAFLLTAKTNLHVGAGGENYGIIDNLVQRDATTAFPTINSTSLKGAIREYFEDGMEHPDTSMVDVVFGVDLKRKEDKNAKPGAGTFRFFAADLVSIPVRSDKKLFVNLTCPSIARQMLDRANALGIKFSEAKENALKAVAGCLKGSKAEAVHFGKNPEWVLEELDIVAERQDAFPELGDAKEIFGNGLVVAKDSTFQELTDNLHLPVVARNQLNNGISENLWYEQLLPRETRFWFPVLYPDGGKEGGHFINFRADLLKHPVQIGANASVGYGFCAITDFPNQ